MSVINEVMEAVIGLINADSIADFPPCTRGALPTGKGLVCEPDPAIVQDLFFDKNTFVPIDVTINAKHPNLKTLSDVMNNIHSRLTRRRVYPSGEGWQISDIKNETLPRIIGREDNNDWIMASGLTVEFYWRGE